MTDDPSSSAPPLKRIKLVHRVPDPTYTHHDQLPSRKLAFPGKIPELLTSFYRLEDDDPDMTLDELQELAAEDGGHLAQDFRLRRDGRLHGPIQPVKKQVMPSRPQDVWDEVIDQLPTEVKVVRDAAKVRVNGAKKVAKLVVAHWEKVAAADDKERKAEERRVLMLAKTTLKAVTNQWKDAVKVRQLLANNDRCDFTQRTVSFVVRQAEEARTS